VDRAGHMSFVEQTEAYLAQVREFLAGARERS